MIHPNAIPMQKAIIIWDLCIVEGFDDFMYTAKLITKITIAMATMNPAPVKPIPISKTVDNVSNTPQINPKTNDTT